MKATAKDLRIHSKELLDAVSRGENVVITFRGKPCAKLVPYENGNEDGGETKDSGVFGLWADRDDIESVEDFVRDLRKSRFF
jgi:prevent-host-death family protein